MKKFSVLILAIIYLGVSSGIAMNIHYCMGKFSSVDLMHNSDKCGKCGMKTGDNKCCNEKFKIVKLTDSHKIISNEININIPVAIIDNSKSIFDADFKNSLVNSEFNNHSPPVSQGISLCILNSLFRI